MKEKRWAVVFCWCLVIGTLVLPLKTMTATAAEMYGDIQTDGAKTQVTISVSGYVQLPAAVTTEVPETPDQKPKSPDESDGTTAVALGADMKKSAPQTSDDTHTGRLLQQLVIAGMIIIRMGSRIKAGRMNNIEVLEQVW